MRSKKERQRASLVPAISLLDIPLHAPCPPRKAWKSASTSFHPIQTIFRQCVDKLEAPNLLAGKLLAASFSAHKASPHVLWESTDETTTATHVMLSFQVTASATAGQSLEVANARADSRTRILGGVPVRVRRRS